MADVEFLNVLTIFEACARLEQGAELAGLAAHIYHRFLKKTNKFRKYDRYILGAAAIKLAYWFYDYPLEIDNLVMIMIGLAHGPNAFLSDPVRSKLAQSIDLMANLITVNLEFEINFKSTVMTTPGILLNSYAASRNQPGAPSTSNNSDLFDADYEDNMLSKIDKSLISGHRYLIHYLKSIHTMIEQAQENSFFKVCNIAWIIMSDIHWSPFIVVNRLPHLACACLTMAIEICRDDLELDDEPVKMRLWQLLNKKWNLIFCDDLSSRQLNILIESIVSQYGTHQALMDREFAPDVSSL